MLWKWSTSATIIAMTDPKLPATEATDTYESPSITRVGSLSELTRNALRAGGDAPLSPSTAFGPDS